MKVLVEADLFLYFDDNDISASLFLGPDQSDPYTHKFTLEGMFDHLFEMEEIPNKMKISYSGAQEVRKVAAYLRQVAREAEERLDKYEILKEKK
jgi:hypothetical protein